MVLPLTVGDQQGANGIDSLSGNTFAKVGAWKTSGGSGRSYLNHFRVTAQGKVSAVFILVTVCHHRFLLRLTMN